MQQRDLDDCRNVVWCADQHTGPHYICFAHIFPPVPNVWLRPNNQKKESDAAKAMLTVPDGDHLTMLNVYNNYMQSEYRPHNKLARGAQHALTSLADLNDKNWCWNNYLSQRALGQADNVRNQLKRVMEKQDIDIVSTADQRVFYPNIRKALICGFFMQVAHKEGEKGNYLTVKDNQVCVQEQCIVCVAELTVNTAGRRFAPFVWS